MRVVSYNIRAEVTKGRKEELDAFFDNSSSYPGKSDKPYSISEIKDKTQEVYFVTFPDHLSYNVAFIKCDDGTLIFLKNNNSANSQEKFIGTNGMMLHMTVGWCDLFAPPIETQLMYTASCKVCNQLLEQGSSIIFG